MTTMPNCPFDYTPLTAAEIAAAETKFADKPRTLNLARADHPQAVAWVRKMLAGAGVALSLLFAPIADAKPHGKHHRLGKPSDAAVEAYVVACINERTGPDGGLPVKDAIKLCQGIGRHQARIAKLAQKAADAIEACHEEVSIACEDTTERETDGGECSDATLAAKHAFDVCTGHGPAWTEGK